ncbi:MAG TPA: phage baseplate assembly protein V [Thermoanaerobaculia bacterium]|nr:phage baseplate assembly protein V [Thermoanaerobaculia bacterium]
MKYFGKYRGKVANNVDPLQQGRLQVEVPKVLGDNTLSWAMPCVPFAGPGVGFFALPPVGANLWVEFEEGDIDYPIWSGCFWDTGQLPVKPGTPFVVALKTKSVTLNLVDLPGAGGFTLEVKPPAVATPLKLAFTSSGIEIQNGKNSIKLSVASVNINNGALEII